MSNFQGISSGAGAGGGTGYAGVRLRLLGHKDVGKKSVLAKMLDTYLMGGLTDTFGSVFDFKVVTLGIDPREQHEPAYYREPMGIMLVYDMTNETSFTKIEEWLGNMGQYASPNVVKIVVGNKSDFAATRVIPKRRAMALANQYQLKYFEVSGETGENVREALLAIANVVMGRVAA